MTWHLPPIRLSTYSERANDGAGYGLPIHRILRSRRVPDILKRLAAKWWNACTDIYIMRLRLNEIEINFGVSEGDNDESLREVFLELPSIFVLILSGCAALVLTLINLPYEACIYVYNKRERNKRLGRSVWN
jgi:hypothetical protein